MTRPAGRAGRRWALYAGLFTLGLFLSLVVYVALRRQVEAPGLGTRPAPGPALTPVLPEARIVPPIEHPQAAATPAVVPAEELAEESSRLDRCLREAIELVRHGVDRRSRLAQSGAANLALYDLRLEAREGAGPGRAETEGEFGARCARVREELDSWDWLSVSVQPAAASADSAHRDARFTCARALAALNEYMPGRRNEAACALQDALRLDPHLAEAHEGYAWLEALRALDGPAEDAPALWDAAADACTRWVEAHPAHLPLRLLRAGARGNAALARARAGADPAASLAAALDDYTVVLGVRADLPVPFLNRGLLHGAAAQWREDHGADPEGAYTAAVTDLTRSLDLGPPWATALQARACAFAALARLGSTRGEAPGPRVEKALRDFAAAIRLDPRHAAARAGRGRLYYQLGRWSDAASDLEAAVLLQPDQPALLPLLEDARRNLATASAAAASDWGTALEPAIRLFQAGEQCMQDGRHREARIAYEDGVRQAEEALAPLAPPDRERLLTHGPRGGLRRALQSAHYNLACAFALESDQAPPRESAEMRAAAFLHLDQARELGWRDRAHLEQDADLESLRSDPRWRALLDSLQ